MIREEFRSICKGRHLNKELAISNLAIAITSTLFVDSLNDFYNETDDYGSLEGYIFSNNFVGNDDESFYFGKDKIKFYYDVHNDMQEEVLTYTEFYEYLKTACDFYLELYPHQEQEVLPILEKIRERYSSRESRRLA
jgi:hypothetical protein